MKCPYCESRMYCRKTIPINKHQEYFTDHYVYKHRMYKCPNCGTKISTKEVLFNLYKYVTEKDFEQEN